MRMSRLGEGVVVVVDDDSGLAKVLLLIIWRVKGVLGEKSRRKGRRERGVDAGMLFLV